MCKCGALREMFGDVGIVEEKLTCVSELLVPVDGENNQQVAKYVDHDGEDENAPQSARKPRRTAEWKLVRGERGNVR